MNWTVIIDLRFNYILCSRLLPNNKCELQCISHADKSDIQKIFFWQIKALSMASLILWLMHTQYIIISEIFVKFFSIFFYSEHIRKFWYNYFYFIIITTIIGTEKIKIKLKITACRYPIDCVIMTASINISPSFIEVSPQFFFIYNLCWTIGLTKSFMWRYLLNEKYL